MIKNKAFVFRIFPDEDQKQFFAQTFGNIRYFYNKFIYDNYIELAGRNIRNHSINQPAKLKQDHQFLKLGDSLALCNAQRNLQKSLKKANAFDTISAKKQKIKKILTNKNNLSADIITKKIKKAERFGLPKFKLKSGVQSYTTNNQFSKNNIPSIKLEDNLLFLPKIKSGIKIHRHRSINKNMLIKSVTIKKSYQDYAGVNLKKEGYRILLEMYRGVYTPKKRDPNKDLYKLITERNTSGEPVNLNRLSCADYSALHGNKQAPTLNHLVK